MSEKTSFDVFLESLGEECIGDYDLAERAYFAGMRQALRTLNQAASMSALKDMTKVIFE